MPERAGQPFFMGPFIVQITISIIFFMAIMAKDDGTIELNASTLFS